MWGVMRGADAREIRESTKSFGVPTGAQPIDRMRLALWLCYQLTCSFWNLPTRDGCVRCGAPREVS